MDRPQIYDQAQGRDYDVLHGWRKALYGLGQAVMDFLGSNSTVVTGLAATATGPASLTINLAAGDIYQLAQVDATAYGSLPADTNTTMQQGYAAAQQLTLSTAGLSSGQSRWALVQATFTQTDDIPNDDPNAGLLPYLNASNPTGPAWSGPGNNGLAQNTRRKGVCTVSVIYGTVAASGTEVPPNPQSGNVPLYLIDLTFGQTQINTNQILVAGPSVGLNVPNNYQQAPFMAGLLQSHHSGGAGQAPQIKLASEVQGQLPLANNINAVQWMSQVWNDGGTANVYSITLSPVPANWAALQGVPLLVKIANTNTSAATATFNPNGLGAKNLIAADGSVIEPSDLSATGIYMFVYDGTNVQVTSVAGRVASGIKKSVVNVPNTNTPTDCGFVDYGLFVFVYDYGAEGFAGTTFCDVVAYTPFQTPTVIASLSTTSSGSPGTRAYTADSVTGQLRIALTGAVAGARAVNVACLGAFASF